MIVEAFYEVSQDADVVFSDVSRESWAYSYIATAHKLNIIKGNEKGFGLGENIKREDAAVVLARVHGINEGTSVGFIDKDSISIYALDSVKTLNSLGIINGDLQGNFNPRSSLTRAEAAKMIYGMLVNVKGGNK